MLQSLFKITELDWLLLGCLGGLMLYQIYFYVRYMAGVQRRVRHQRNGTFRWKKQAAAEADPAAQAESNARPGVSVVVCARNEEDNLQNYLQALVTQKYPEFEVIVVNDASCDNTQLVLEHYTQLFRNLRLTFVPADAWVRSSKKLALTLAAKASKYDYLLLTDADCCPESPYWIDEMMHGFDNPDTEVVLGYGGYFADGSRINRLIQYDTIFNAMQFLGMAMSRHPYMGIGRNLAYKKSTFFSHNGFAGLLNERAGDDDLLVNKISTRKNTDVVLTPNSYTWSVPKRTLGEWRIQKYRHLSVSPAYRLGTKIRLAIEPLTRGLWYALMIAVVVLSVMGYIQSPLVWAAAAICFVARLTWQIAIMNRAATILRAPHFGLNVLLFDIYLPVSNLVMLIRHAIHRKQELRW